MLSTALGFPKGKRVTDHYAILAQEAVGFSQGLHKCCSHHELNENTIISTWYRDKYYFYEWEICSYLYTQHFTRGNRVFAIASIFFSVALAFHGGSCFNASLSRYTLLIYLVFKKLILKM